MREGVFCWSALDKRLLTPFDDLFYTDEAKGELANEKGCHQ
jgi:hypothetical protein